MSLQTRLSALITAIGTDVKALDTRVDALELSGGGSFLATFVVGNTSAITTGVKKAYWTVPATGTITKWKIMTDLSSSTSIQVLKASTLPTFSALGTATMSAAYTATGIPSWAVTAGDILDIEVLSNNNATKLVVELTIT